MSMQENLEQKVKTIIAKTGLKDATVDFDEANKRISIIVGEDEWFKKWVPDLVRHIKHLVNIIAHKETDATYFVDINNYRKERERLIVELAKAAARKATLEKHDVRLPAMNSYERRLVHAELSMRPDVKTESVGEGKERAVIVRPTEL